MRAMLRELERLSIDNPKEAIRRSLEAMAEVLPEQMPALYGICGSAYRRLDDDKTAFLVLHEGILLARRSSDLDSEAQLLQRTAYVYAERGDFTRALRATESAVVKFVSAGNLRGASRSMLDQGQWHYYLGSLQQSIRICKSAFRALPVDEIANRFATLQGISLCYADLDQPRRAIKYAGLAHRFKGTVSPALWSKQLWLEARIFEQLGDFESAERLLSQTLHDFLRTEAFLDAALACTEITRLALKAGRLQDAIMLAKSFGQYLITNQRLANNDIAASALMELARCAVTGQDLQDAVVEIKKRLGRARARPRTKPLSR